MAAPPSHTAALRPDEKSRIQTPDDRFCSAYAMRAYVNPLVDSGRLTLGIPDRPKSPRQTYKTSNDRSAISST